MSPIQIVCPPQASGMTAVAWIGVVSTLLTLVAIAVALRAQRVSNVNALRERQMRAYAQARMVVVERSLQDDSLVLANYGDNSILEVRTQRLIAGANALLGAGISHSFPIMTPQQILPIPSSPEHLEDGSTTLSWAFIWNDCFGYKWNGSYTDDGVHPSKTETPIIRERPRGSGPLTDEKTLWQRFRNVIVPYDYWPVDSQTIAKE